MKKIIACRLLVLVAGYGCSFLFGPKQEKTAAELVEQGRAEFADADYKKAIEAYRKLKDWYPFSQYAKEAELKIADAHYRLEEYELEPSTARHVRVVCLGNDSGAHGKWNNIMETRINALPFPEAYPPRVSAPGLEKTCRTLLPHRPEPRRSGGSVSFTLDCDPDGQNYLTLKFWGGKKTYGNLHLFHGKKQISCLSSQDGWPALDGFNKKPRSPFPGRFWYSTYPIPRSITDGKDSVRLRVVSFGSWYNYVSPYKRSQNLQRLNVQITCEPLPVTTTGSKISDKLLK